MRKWSLVAGVMALFACFVAGAKPKTRGKVCFTFDDARYREWLPVLPLFQKYHAHATFFFNGEITPEVIDAMKQLTAAGHSVGVHTVNHRDAVPAIPEQGAESYIQSQIQPQLDACKAAGIRIRFFAYPNNRHTEETDRILASKCGFTRFRAGVPNHRKSGFTIAQDKQGFLKPEALAGTLTLGGFGIGEYYQTTQAELDDALEEAARTGTVLTFFSHGISNQPNRIDVGIPMLEACLKKAEKLGLEVVSFDDLEPQKE